MPRPWEKDRLSFSRQNHCRDQLRPHLFGAQKDQLQHGLCRPSRRHHRAFGFPFSGNHSTAIEQKGVPRFVVAVECRAMSDYKVGDHVLLKLSGGRIVEATIKAIVDTTEGVRLQIGSRGALGRTEKTL
jgi:hypothetical protein